MPAGYWSGTPLRTLLVNVTDVQTILDEYVSQITTQLPVAERWTAMGGGVYKNPVDAAGAFMTVELIRDTATRLSVVVRDHLNRVVQDGSHVIASGDNCYLYSGKNHLCFQSTPGADANSAFWISMVDVSPELPTVHTSRVACNLKYSNVGGHLGGNLHYASIYSLFDGTVSRSQYRIEAWGNTDFAQYRMKTVGGAYISTYVWIVHSVLSAGTLAVAGILNQVAFMDIDRPARTIHSAPIDVGVNGRFEVMDFAQAQHCFLAVRVPDNL